MKFGVKDLTRLLLLNGFVFIFTRYMRDGYSNIEVVLAMIYVTIVYLVVSLIKNRRRKSTT